VGLHQRHRSTGEEATLKSFDLASGTLKGAHPFPDGGLCNDIEVSRHGTVLATDTRGGRILALKSGATPLAVWAVNAKWIGIDGLAMLADRSVLFNNARQNQLVRVEMNADGTAGTETLLELSQPVSGPDGVRALRDGRIIMVENQSGKIDLVGVEGDKATIETVKGGFMQSPIAVTVDNKTAWVIETKFAYRNDSQFKDKDPEPFGTTAVPLPPR
jgi:hypothetical protein